MSNSISAQHTPLKLRSLYDSLMPYEWMYLQMHNSLSDSATRAYDRAFGTAGQSTALFVNGLTTFVDGNPDWTTNAGFWTPDGTNYQKITTEALRAFCDFSTLDTGGMLIAFRIAVTDPTPTGAEYIVTHSTTDPDNGGFGVSFNTAGAMFVSVKGQGVAEVNVCNFGTVMAANTEYSYCIYIDLKNNDAYIFRDGVAGNQSTNPINTPYPNMEAAKGFCIGAKSGAVASGKLGQKGSGGRVRDLFMARITSDMSADIGTIAQQFADNVGDIPRKLVEDYV